MGTIDKIRLLIVQEIQKNIRRLAQITNIDEHSAAEGADVEQKVQDLEQALTLIKE